MAQTATTSSTPKNSGRMKSYFIYEINPTTKQKLCSHLDELNVWEQLADTMRFGIDVKMQIQRLTNSGQSPTEELLNIWGYDYDHTAEELFFVFKKRRLFEAMRIIKDFVPQKYHFLIPSSQPVISELIAKSQTKQNNNNGQSKKLLNYTTSSGVSNSDNVTTSYFGTTSSNNTSESIPGNVIRPPKSDEPRLVSIIEISYDELTQATNNWCKDNILGMGGFGTVYRGRWKLTDVAVKQIHYKGTDDPQNVRIQIQQSLNELKCLDTCRHDNILPIYGYSLKGDLPCLVYQLMTGGSLGQRLNSKKMVPLDFTQRIKICLGTARGINYLHTFRDGRPLIHGDIKPVNVLLDQCLQPKIGDFGLARDGPGTNDSAIKVSQVFGTLPYLPPEFLHAKKLSTQVDTYSFGVLLLETFTILRTHEIARTDCRINKYVKKHCENPENKLEDLIDIFIRRNINELKLGTRLIHLGLMCTADKPQDRPSMENVYDVIEKCVAVL